MHHQILTKHLQEVRSIENYPKSGTLSTTRMRTSARQAGRLRQQLLPSLPVPWTVGSGCLHQCHLPHAPSLGSPSLSPPLLCNPTHPH